MTNIADHQLIFGVKKLMIFYIGSDKNISPFLQGFCGHIVIVRASQHDEGNGQGAGRSLTGVISAVVRPAPGCRNAWRPVMSSVSTTK